jgi:hypothetical protein
LAKEEAHLVSKGLVASSSSRRTIEEEPPALSILGKRFEGTPFYATVCIRS